MAAVTTNQLRHPPPTKRKRERATMLVRRTASCSRIRSPSRVWVLTNIAFAVVLFVGVSQPALGFAVGPASSSGDRQCCGGLVLPQQQQQQQPRRKQVVTLLPRPGAVPHDQQRNRDLRLRASKPSSSDTDTDPAAAFEYQELKIQLDALQRAKISPGKINPLQRIELLGYVKEVVARRRKSSIALSAETLRGTSWRLVFSHGDDASALGDLPSGASVVLRFGNDDNDDDNNNNNNNNASSPNKKLDYALEFGPESLGLRNLVAHSTWQLDHDNNNHLVYTYDHITSDLLGFQNIPVGLFGLLKGRTSSIFTSYFDGTYWIEQGYGPTGNEYCNVYVREQR